MFILQSFGIVFLIIFSLFTITFIITDLSLTLYVEAEFRKRRKAITAAVADLGLKNMECPRTNSTLSKE